VVAAAVISAASLLVRWIPLRATMVNEYEQGVRWWKGRATTLLTKPGVYVFIPWLGDITTESIKPQEVETSLQAVEDHEKHTRSVSFGLQYEVVDLLRHQTCVTDFEESLLNLVERTACEVIQSGETDHLKSLRRKVRQQCLEWGVKIHRLGYINNARVRPIHILRGDI